MLLQEAAGPVLAAAVRTHGPLDVMSLAAQAVAMGDDVHVRTQAATNLLLRNLLPHLVAGDHPRRVEVAAFLSGNYLLFLSLAMAAARALTTWAAQVELSSVVTGMARNGTDFVGWLAGPQAEWHYAPAPMVGRALYQPGPRVPRRRPTSATARSSSSSVSAGRARRARRRSRRSWAARWPTRPS